MRSGDQSTPQAPDLRVHPRTWPRTPISCGTPVLPGPRSQVPQTRPRDQIVINGAVQQLRLSF